PRIQQRKKLESLLVKFANLCTEMEVGPRAFVSILLLVTGLASGACGQPSDQSRSIRGVVVNGPTHEPISKALVYSPDNRFATITDGQGRFEIVVQSSGSTPQPDQNPIPDATSGVRTGLSVKWTRSAPTMLMARKPGFLQDPSGSAVAIQEN